MSAYTDAIRNNLHQVVEEYINSYDGWAGVSPETQAREESDRDSRAEDFMHYLANNLVTVNREEGLVFTFTVQMHAAHIATGEDVGDLEEYWSTTPMPK